jgi:hypothetical protein
VILVRKGPTAQSENDCFQNLTSSVVRVLNYLSITSLSHFWGEYMYKRGKAIPVTGRGGPQGCETSMLPHFLDSRLTDGGEIVSLTRWPAGRHLPTGRFLVLISVRG